MAVVRPAYLYNHDSPNGQGLWSQADISLEDLYRHAHSGSKSIIVFSDSTVLREYPDFFKSHHSPGMLDIYLDDISQNASGYFWAGRSPDADGQPSSYLTMFQFLPKHPNGPSQYVWRRFSFLTMCKINGGSALLCLDFTPEMQARVGHRLLNGSGNAANHAFSLHAFILGEIVHDFDQAVWEWRDCVRALEKDRPSSTQPRRDYPSMHDTARHIIQCSELLAMALSVMDSLVEEFEQYCETHPDPTNAATVRQTFNFHKSMLRCLQLRSRALEERMKNEINLAFNVNAQHDSYLALLTADLAQRDSTTMKGISILGMLFLPGTFISAIFSMSFFHIGSDSQGHPNYWTVAKEFWVYWAVALPVTLITVVMWLSWQRVAVRSTRGVRKEQGDMLD